ncbi:MAG TPA: TonB-dependent receptor [Steroidobacteraceae bacterium]
MRTELTFCPLVAAVCCTALVSPSAHAAEQGAAEQQVQLEEIIVTAQKREEKLKDVPISIVALSGATLKETDVRTLSDLAAEVPDVHIGQSFSQGYLSVRGLSSGTNPGFETTVGQVVDGIFYPRDRFAYLSFLDLDRVEVLKGPQGALIGKNTTAGVINITTQQPTDTFSASTLIEREVTGDTGWNTETAVSGPLTNTLDARVAIRTENHTGYEARVVTGGLEPTRDDKYGRVSFLWRPTDDLTVTLHAGRAEVHQHGRPIELINCSSGLITKSLKGIYPNIEDCSLNWKTAENYGRPAPFFGPGQYDLQQNYANTESLTVAWKTRWGTVTSLTGYADFNFTGQETGYRTDIDTRFVDLGERWGQISEELRLVSNPGGPLDYIVGGYYLTSHQDTIDGIATFPPSNPVVEQFTFAHVHSDTYSGFGDLTWHISHFFDATLEGRYTKENKQAQLYEENIGLANPEIKKGLVYNISPSRSENNFTPGVKLAWKPNADVLAYASWSQGYKGGGFNDFLTAANNTAATQQSQFGPEKTNAYELGSKIAFDDGKALFTAAVFRSQTSNLQVTAVVPVGLLSGFAVENAGRTTNQGVEADLSWRPIAPLTLTARGAFLSAKYASFPASQCYRTQTLAQGCVPGSNGSSQNLTGTDIPLAPRTSGSLEGRYVWSLVDGWKLSLFAQMVYSAKYQTDFTNDPSAIEPQFEKYNARLSLEKDHLQLSVVGRNLTDTKTFIGGGAISLSTGTTSDYAEVDPPREIILQAGYHF